MKTAALIPVPQAGDDRRVARGFWPKIARVAARIPFAEKALALYFCARDPATPAKAKAMMLAALAYFILPTDVIPDVLAGVGFTDDAAVLAAVVAVVGASLKPRHKAMAKAAVTALRAKI